ncbi:MAG: AraC family transcriptional regulator [Eubacteriaceae bacterium]|nr:AraC family transcriptional regulator [Eubacteriaceae bacterium]
MEWITALKSAIAYIEENLETVSGADEVAEQVHMSAFYLSRGFQIATGYSVGEYIRCRRLYEAAMRLSHQSGYRVIDAALDAGYETPESFSKAFARFHGFPPSEMKKNMNRFRIFRPLAISIKVTGGDRMEYRIEKKAAVTMIGFEREFKEDDSYKRIPEFWDEVFDRYGDDSVDEEGTGALVRKAVAENGIGQYGICTDDKGDGVFSYMIAGEYSGGDVPEGLKLREIPAAEWAVFPCKGPLPEALQTVNTAIWKEWLPGNRDFELAGSYTIEWYSVSGDSKASDYESAIWIPVKEKTE